ncbi:hypothetical protein C6497_06050 [Candidatus Poribacteria bacterium]|nr:MAG: hypothetical protein C6497_06050 [Candidatus Poribacteria bacterium]
MQLIKHFSEITTDDQLLVGGKGLNLGKLTNAGFSVPNGFCITTEAYRSSVEHLSEQNEYNIRDISLKPELVEEILRARQELHTDSVAVRSSATAEDLEDASFAGQQDTFLNVKSNEIIDAVKNCWTSLWTTRAVSYRKNQGISNDGLAMAVVVQEMCKADVSGVLFTVSPFSNQSCIIESNWGLGESVVSGSITPDSYELSRDTGKVVNKTIATKQEMITDTGITKISEDQQNAPTLTNEQLQKLYKLGLEIERLYKQPMDVEWGLTGEDFFLLQARPITTKVGSKNQSVEKDNEIQKLRQAEVEILRTIAIENTIWSHHNLAEVLPAPLPMTWEIMKQFMSGNGGLGKAYRDLGFYPSKKVDRIGILDLICGRIYVNLNRETELFFAGFPFAHDYYELKLVPQQAMYAQAKPDIRHSKASFWLKLPLHIIRMTKAEMRLRKYRSDFDQVLTMEVFPEFQNTVQIEQSKDFSELSDAELMDKVNEWIQNTLEDFAPKALIATLLAGFSLQRLENTLQKCMSDGEVKQLVSCLITGPSGNMTIETNEKLRQVANEQISLSEFLKVYGHRAVDEFELAEPRWRENTKYLEQIIESLNQDSPDNHNDEYSDSKQKELKEIAEKELKDAIMKKPGMQKQIETELDYTRRYMPFRETAKYYLMLGYEQIRRSLVELDNRYELDGGIFYLIPDELVRLISGENLRQVISERKLERELLLQIELPDVIFSDSLDEIGKSKTREQSKTYSGLGVSAGIGIGHARVLSQPSEINPSDRNYILICPSTDPAWTPLFLNASGLVMERGGMLSHGAVVAREYGIPAVVNISNATHNISDGQMIEVNGNNGKVAIVSE